MGAQLQDGSIDSPFLAGWNSCSRASLKVGFVRAGEGTLELYMVYIVESMGDENGREVEV